MMHSVQHIRGGRPSISADFGQPVIEVASMSKSYGDFDVIKDISLTVRQGERIVLCGPSGSGKSTFIRCINQLEPIQRGHIKINGTDISAPLAKANEALRDIGMVFQNFNLFPHMTVLDNCMLAPVSVRGVSKKEAEDLARNFLQKVGIESHCHKYPSQLSGGQQQRVAIARALCMQPKIMLFDEPTSALDPEMVNEVLDVMLKLADSGMTMLCVTHEMAFARKFSSRVLFFDGGKILEDTDPEAFFIAPMTDRAQTFLSQIKH